MSNKRTLTIFILITLLVGLCGIPPASAAPKATTYTVNSDTDAQDANPGDGVCATAGGKCTLRAAIEEANTHTGYQTIHFASMFQQPHDIEGCLPPITTDNLTIDASNWWDTAYNRPGVEIAGSTCDLLVINASNTSVMGVFFGGGGSTGVRITGGSLNSIGGWGTGQRNVFITGQYGVWIQSSGTYNYVINNYFGTVDGQGVPGGTPYNGVSGVHVFAGDSFSVISGNLIVGQSSAGIFLWANGNIVTDNIVGLNKTKSGVLPNHIGVQLEGDGNVIGPGNVIAGNDSHGVYVHHADDCLIYENFIGYPFGISDLGNGEHGIFVHASANTEISGNNVIAKNDGHGVYAWGASGVTIQGNGISESNLDGVFFQSGDGTIGGVGTSGRNIISANSGNGVRLNGTSAMTVTGNYIGLDDAGGFDVGNGGHGIVVENGAQNTLIGGAGPGEGNWIAFNDGHGILLTGSSTQYSFLIGNVIGAPINFGWEAPNGLHGVGVYDGAHNNYVGTLDGGNTIVASGWSGVAVVESNLNTVLLNHIGTNGVAANWGNAFYGVDVYNSTDTAITFNEIAYNGTAGGTDDGQAGVRIRATGSTGNIISQNSIHDNDGPGIELAEGGNGNLAAPNITEANCNLVRGTTSPVCANCVIEVFSDSADEGRTYEGSFITPPTGVFTWTGTLSGPKVTVTARENSTRDTSPFSNEVNVGTCNHVPVAAFTVSPTRGYTRTVFSFDASGSSDIEDASGVLEVRWDWDNNGVYDTGWSTTKTAIHSFWWFATHTVRLEVMDTRGLKDTTTCQVVVTQEYRVLLPLVVRN